MLYEIIIGGEFQNVKGIAAEQTFRVVPKCTSCDTEHANHVVVSSESEKREDDTGRFNLIMSCNICKRKMKIKIQMPRSVEVECTNSETKEFGLVEMRLAEERGDSFVISRVHTTGCRLSGLELPQIDVLSTENVLFKDILIEENSWAGASSAESISSIGMLSISLSEEK
nr:hypothetical protein [Antonospora locustae]|eukprot:jgi/Antlo1/1446/2541